MMICLKPTNY